MNLKNRTKTKIFFKALVLEILFLFILFFAGKFFISKMYKIILTLGSSQNFLNQLQNFNQDTATLDEINDARGLIAQISGSIDQLLLYLTLFIIIIFLVYVIIKSIQWNVIYNGKLTNYKKYITKFAVLTLAMFTILIILIFNILKYSRTFLIPYMFEGTIQYNTLITVLIFIILSLIFIYLFFTGYIYANKLNFTNTIKEMLKFKKFCLFFILIIIFIVSSIIIRYSLMFSQSIINVTIQIIVISTLTVWYKFYLFEKLK